MAPGSQKWNGKMADLLSAPTSSITIAAFKATAWPRSKIGPVSSIVVMLVVP